MSSVDQYKHKVLGHIECPSNYDLIFGNTTRILPIYQLEQDVPADENDFDGKVGDILLGGGSGEAPALRIAYPEAMCFFEIDGWSDFEDYDDLFKHFWSPTFAYKAGVGFQKMGWEPETPLEWWVSEKVINTLLESGAISLNGCNSSVHAP